jgi:hypothetical protein
LAALSATWNSGPGGLVDLDVGGLGRQGHGGHQGVGIGIVQLGLGMVFQALEPREQHLDPLALGRRDALGGGALLGEGLASG